MIIQDSHALCPILYHFFFPNRMLISKLMHPFIVGLFIDFQFLCVIYPIRFSIQVSLQHNQIANVSDISFITLRKNMLYGRIILKNLLLLIITIELLKRILTFHISCHRFLGKTKREISTRKASLPTLALQSRKHLWKTSSTVSPSTIPVPRF